MNKIIHRRLVLTLVATLTILSTAILSVGASPVVPAPQAPQSMSGGPIAVVRKAPMGSDLRVPPPPEFSELGIQSAAVSVIYLPGGTYNVAGTYCYDWPTDAKTAFNYAASIWASQLNSSVPIKINACWAELDPGVLGYGGSVSYHRNFTGGQSNTWYPASAANALSGTDLNDSDGSDSDADGNDADADMVVAYSRTYDWYYGTDGNTPAGKIDFASVVLHEICHGLGFAGSMRVSGGQGYYGLITGDDDPITYDRFAENGSGTPLLSYTNGSSTLATQLTSNNVYFDGTNANAANGGSQPKLFAPSTWMQGSSYSHLDEIFNGTENALMTYSIGNGESIHSAGPVALGVLQDLGWVFSENPDVSIIKQVVGGPDFAPGDPIAFTLDIANSGNAVASDVVVTDDVPDEVMSLSYDSTLTVTPVGSDPYVWNVEPLDIGESGVITITGQIDPGLDAGFSFVNTATISDPEDDTSANNRSSVIVGQNKIYLPLVSRRWPPIPGGPVLNAIDNSDGDGNYTVSWGAADLADTYTLQEDDNASFSSPTTRYSGSGTSWNASNMSGGTYYYRVEANNSWGSSGWSNVQSVTVQAQTGWVTILSDNIEGSFPGSNWTVSDSDSYSGRYYWGKRDCKPRSGSYSAWNVGAGDSTVSCGSDYRNDMFAWMVYGPFSLSGASAAELIFDWWSDTEYDYDIFFWGASTNGENYYGTVVTGDYSSWTTDQRLNLSNVPTLGNLLGQNQVWIGFAFGSDGSVTDRGSFVDNIVLRKYMGSSASEAQILSPVQRVLQPNQTMGSGQLQLDRRVILPLVEKPR